jgi:hypothetical protein
MTVRAKDCSDLTYMVHLKRNTLVTVIVKRVSALPLARKPVILTVVFSSLTEELEGSPLPITQTFAISIESKSALKRWSAAW